MLRLFISILIFNFLVPLDIRNGKLVSNEVTVEENNTAFTTESNSEDKN